MRRYHVATLLIALTIVSARQVRTVAAAEVYAIDPAHTSIVFSISHFNMSYTYGFFRAHQGGYQFDRANPAGCQFQFAIDVNSLDTNNAKRDQHLKSPDFFNVRQFPTITFQSTSCAQSKNPQGKVVYQVTGNLSILGQSREVTIPLELLGEGPVPGGEFRMGFLGQFELRRSDFGMTHMVGAVGDKVAVTVSFEGVRQQAGTGGPDSRTR